MTRFRQAAVFAAICATGMLATGLTASRAEAQEREKCFGVAKAGQNEGLAKGSGKSRVDFQGDAWVWVPAGTCAAINLPEQADGTPRRGAILPLSRDPG